MVSPQSARDRLAGLMRWGSAALPVLALLSLATAVLRWRELRCGVLSDAWALLRIASMGLPEALFVELSYHVIPVTHLISTVLWNLFGMWEPGYQIVNLAELVLAGWLLYLFGLRLFSGTNRQLVSLVAALLLVANSSFYEVTSWPVIGNFQIAAGLLQLGGLFAVQRSARPAPWLALFGLAAVLAFFTYEPAVSLLPAGVLYAALVPLPGGDRSWRQMARRAAPVLAAAVLAFVPMLAVKIWAASSGSAALFLPEDLHTAAIRLQFLLRSSLSVFTLRGSDEAVVLLYHPAGWAPAWGSVLHVAFFAAWLAVLGSLTLLAPLRSREPALLFLGLWFWIYAGTVSVATLFVSRQTFLAAIPASLLMAWGICRLADAAAGAFARPEDRRVVSAVLALLAFALLALGAKSDIDASASLHRQAKLASRRLRELIVQRVAAGPVEEIAVVNLPARILDQGVGAFAFVNGTQQMTLLTTNSVAVTQSIRFYGTSPDLRNLANGSIHLSLTELARRIEDPGCLVLWFDPQSRTVIELNRTSWRAPREISPETLPFLSWEQAAPPRLRIPPGQSLEVPLALETPDSWGAVQFARGNPGLSFDIAEGGAPRLQVRPRKIGTPGWPVATFPLSAGAGTKALAVRAQTETWVSGIWSFVPPERYTPATSPFLTWWLKADPTLMVYEETLRLPLSTRRCPRSGCAVTIEYLAAPGRDVTFSVEGGERRELTFPAGTPPDWRTLTLRSGEPGASAVLRIEPRGPQPVFLHSIEAGPGPAPSFTAPETDTLVPEMSTGSPRP